MILQCINPLVFKSFGLLCLVLLSYFSFLTIKHSQIDKFGGSQDTYSNNQIIQKKGETIIKTYTHFKI